jgi:hypothetical protein
LEPSPPAALSGHAWPAKIRPEIQSGQQFSLKHVVLAQQSPLVCPSVYIHIESDNIVFMRKGMAYLMSTDKFSENFNGQLK